MSPRVLCLLIPLAACLAPVLAPPPARAQAARPLFNGRDLSGWEGDPRFWSVRDGAITGETTPEKVTPQNTFLIWRGGRLRDFDLKVRWRIRGGNSGIQLRSRDLGNWVVGGYQADFEDGTTWTGVAYEERGRGLLAPLGQKATIGAGGKPVALGDVGDPAAVRAAVRSGDWNEYHITMRGNHWIQRINGVPCAEVVDNDEAGRAMEGILALQLHAGPPMTVQFRDILLTDL